MSRTDNLAVWDGRRGHYEVWYLTLTDRSSGAAFWIRYTLESPVAENEAPYARLWFTSFAPDSTAIHRDVPIEEYAAAPGGGDGFVIRMGDASLSHGSAEGRIGDTRWSLSWKPPRESHRHLPAVAYNVPITSTTVLSPAPAVLFDGEIECGGRRFELRGAPGCQTHLWGRKHAETWAWARASAWDDETAEEVFFEGIAGRVKRFGKVLPPLTVLTLRVGNDTYHHRGLLQAKRTRSTWETGRWSFDSQGRNVRIEGEVTHPPDQLVLARYQDPDGEASYCHNSERSSLHLRLWRRSWPGAAWRRERTLTATGLAHAEWGARRPSPLVTRDIQPI